MQETKKNTNNIDDDDIIKNAYIAYNIKEFYEQKF